MVDLLKPDDHVHRNELIMLEIVIRCFLLCCCGGRQLLHLGNGSVSSESLRYGGHSWPSFVAVASNLENSCFASPGKDSFIIVTLFRSVNK